MKRIVCGLLLVFIFVPVFGQDGDDDSNEETTIKVFEYNSDHTQNTSKPYRMAFKLDPYALLNGDIPIYAEFKVAPKFSVEGSVGITFRDYWGNTLLGMFGDEDLVFSDLSQYRKNNVGNSFRAALKFFPSEDYDAIEGIFFGLQFRRRAYSSVIQKSLVDLDHPVYLGAPPYITGDLKESRVVTDFALLFGGQYFWDSNICYEYNIGIGYRIATNKYARSVTVEEPNNTNGYNHYEQLQLVDKDYTGPSLYFSWKVGFGF